MKIRLSTALLSVALIGASLGWLVDRQKMTTELSQLKQSRASRDAKIYLGSVLMGTSGGKFGILNRFDFDDVDGNLAHVKDDPEFRRLLATECVTEFLDIYENQAAIQFVGELIIGDYDARLNAREALYLLECNDTEEFFEIARSLDDFKNPEYDPELHDTSSAEYKSFHQFVSDTIAIKDQMFFRGFEDDPRGKYRGITK